MAGPTVTSRHSHGHRLWAAFAVVALAASTLTFASAVPRAGAAFQGQPWQTNFEIEPFGSANTTVEGPTPPAGGAGVDWDNGASFLQDFGNPTEPCTGTDPTIIGGKLDAFNFFAPNPVAGQVLGKGDLCQAYIGWEIKNVTVAPGVTELHYILYGAWRRNTVPGEIFFFVPLIGGPTKSDITLVKFNYDSAGGGSTSVHQLRWNGTTWIESPITPPESFDASVNNGGSSPSFGEFAIDLTASNILPRSPAECNTFTTSYVFTQTGNAQQAELKDFLGVPPVEISNCSQVEVTKVTNPAVPDPPATFTYKLDQVDGGPVQDATPNQPPNEDSDPSLNVFHGSLTVPGSPTDNPDNIIAATGYRIVEDLPPPAPWSLQSIVCNYFNPLVLDANLKATPATVTLTNPNGTWNGNTFDVSPTGLLPAGATSAAQCTISNQAPSLTLVKNVVNDVRGPTATPNMWLLAASGPGGVVDYGPGTSQGVSRIVAPGTYTLSESHNSNPAPPLGFTDGTQWSCTPTAVTGANQITIGPSDNVTCTITNTANPAQLTLQKVVNNTSGGSATVGDFTLDATFTTPGDAGSVDGQPISGITGNPSVTDRLVKRGVFNLSETEIPGYVPSWVCVDGTGATISTSNQVNVPVDITNLNQLDITCTVTNTFTSLAIDISAPSINPVGREHTFTLTATKTADGVTTPLVGAILDLDFTTENGLDLADVTIVANTCESAPGTDANGHCTVTVNSSASGVLNVIANGFSNQGLGGPNPGAAFELPSPVSSNKRWREYRVEGAASDINLIGEPHTFTLSGFQIAGTLNGGAPNEGPLQAGALIRFNWNGPGTPTGPTVSAAPGGGFQCVVGVDGTCAVTVTSATPATGTLSVTGIVVELLNGDTTTSTTTYTLNYPDVALQEPAPVLTKAWVAFNVTTSASSVNLIREPHVFTINVTRDVGAGPAPVADGTIVNYNWSGIGTATPPASCVTSGGSCTVTVTSDTFGSGTLTVTGLSNAPVTVGTTSVTFPSVVVDASGALTVPPPVTKTWVLVNVAITPGADNLAGEPHAFTVQVTAFDGPGGFPDGAGVPGAIVAATGVNAVGGAQLTNDGTCDTGTNANGQCTLIVTNPGPGSIVVRLDSVSLTVDGQPFTIPLNASSPGLRPDQVFPIQSDKVWWQYRVILSDSSTNPLGVDHTFIATVQRTNDGTNWQNVPDGAHLDYTWTDPHGFSQVEPDSTCLTDGTVAGQCTFIVSSTAATTGTLEIHGILDTWLDRNRDGDRGAPGDPTPDANELAAEIVDVPASALDQLTSRLDATKTWFNFAIDITGPAENPVGTDHTFTATVTYSDGSAAGFQAVHDGTTLTYAWTGPAGSGEDTGASTCDVGDAVGTQNGQCTITISSPNVPGTGTLTITGIASTQIPQPERDVSFTFPTPATTTKTWVALRALISPNSVNLAGNPHTFTITLQLDMGGGFASVADGTKVAVSLSDPTKLVSENCSTTGTVNNQCSVTVDSDDPGSVTVTPGAITVELLDGTGGRVPVTVQPGSDAYETPDSSTKVWVAFRLGVTPSATNLVGDPHTFEVTVEYATTPNQFQPVGSGTLAFVWNSAVGTVDAAGSTCPTLSASGTCTVTVNSNVTGTGTLTLQGLAVTTVNVNGVPTQFTNVNATNAPNAITFTRDIATKTWVDFQVTVTPETATNYVGQEHTFTVLVEGDADGGGFQPIAGANVGLTTTGTAVVDPAIPSSCITNSDGKCFITTNAAAPGTLTLTATYNAAIGDSEVTSPFFDSGSKQWIPRWTLTVAKASPVTNSTQEFAFQTTGPDPLADGSFPLAIGQTKLFEGLLPGTYTVEELADAANLPAPWKFASVECTGLADSGTASYNGSTATLTLAEGSAGTDITCTFTNEQETTVVPEATPPVPPPPAPEPTPLLPFTGSNGLPYRAALVLILAGVALVMVTRRWRRRGRLLRSELL